MRWIAAVLRAAPDPGAAARRRDPVLVGAPPMAVMLGGWFLVDHARLTAAL